MKWKCKDAREVELKDMSVSHLHNTIAMLRRKGIVTPREFLSCCAYAYSDDTPEGAAMAAEAEVDRMKPSSMLANLEEELASRSSLTLEHIEEAVRRAEANRAPVVAPFFMTPQRTLRAFSGLNIVEAPERVEPVLRLRDDAPVSDAFREAMNAYLLDLFGTRDTSLIPRGTAYLFGGNVAMRSSDVVRLSGAAV